MSLINVIKDFFDNKYKNNLNQYHNDINISVYYNDFDYLLCRFFLNEFSCKNCTKKNYLNHSISVYRLVNNKESIETFKNIIKNHIFNIIKCDDNQLFNKFDKNIKEKIYFDDLGKNYFLITNKDVLKKDDNELVEIDDKDIFNKKDKKYKATSFTIKYLTPYIDNKNIVEKIQEKIKKDKIKIIDANGLIGDTSILFSDYFNTIITFENDEVNYNILESNTKDINNIKIIKGDILNFKDIDCDVIYFNLPYNKEDEKLNLLNLYYNNLELSLVINKIKNLYKPEYIFIKVPKNYNHNLLKKVLEDYEINTFKNFNLIVKKMF